MDGRDTNLRKTRKLQFSKTLNIMHTYIAGIDIGGTNTIIGLVDENGKICNRSSISTPGHPDPELFFRKIAHLISKSDCLANGNGILAGIGIGAPNGNYYNGTIEFAPNLEWKGVVPVVKILTNSFPDIPIILTNDANAAAIGEMMFGNAKGLNDFIMITLGTGVGSGIIANGELIYGHDGFAGEIGHTIYDPNGRQCGCGRRGCLETYASAGGITTTAMEMLDKCDTPSILRTIPAQKLNTKEIGDAANAGDVIAIQVFDKTAQILALKLADSVAHTSPSAIFLFGGVTKAGNVLLDPLQKYFESSLLQIYRNKIKLQLSGLPENDAAILGAAALCKQKKSAI